MGKHYSHHLKIIQFILSHQMGVREAAQHFAVRSHSSIVGWLQRFEKYGVNGLIRQSHQKEKIHTPKIKGAKKVKDPNNIKALLARIEYLELENTVLKKFKELDERKLRQKKESSPTP